MELQDAQNLTLEKMREHGLHFWHFTFSNTASRGDCNYSKRRIRLSRPFVLANGRERVLQTILHEIAHALTRRQYPYAKSHGPEWKRIAKSIGHSGQRYMDAEPYSTGRTTKMYVGHCVSCSRRIERSKRMISYACAICCKEHNNGKYDPRFYFIWE